MHHDQHIIDRNRRTVDRFLTGTHSKRIDDVDVIDDTVAPNISCHGFPGNPIVDHESYKGFFRAFRRHFSDMDWTIHALVADEQFVLARWEISATFSGDFAGLWAAVFAARRLPAREDGEASVTLISRDPYLTLRPHQGSCL